MLVQFVEIPGLVEGANEDRGGGRALLGVLRGADAIVFCQDASASPDELKVVQHEVTLAGIELPSLIAATKMDDASETAVLAALGLDFPEFAIIPVSVLDDESLERLKAAVWALLDLVCIRLRHFGKTEAEPIALPLGATVLDVATEIHKDLAVKAKGAKVWGASVRFDGQVVGLAHDVADGDIVEVLT